jgi:hypothetical protein
VGRVSEGQLLTPAELAEREEVTLGTVYNWNHTGKGPRYTRIRRRVMYRLEDVEAWKAAQTEIVNDGQQVPA